MNEKEQCEFRRILTAQTLATITSAFAEDDENWLWMKKSVAEWLANPTSESTQRLEEAMIADIIDGGARRHHYSDDSYLPILILSSRNLAEAARLARQAAAVFAPANETDAEQKALERQIKIARELLGNQ